VTERFCSEFNMAGYRKSPDSCNTVLSALQISKVRQVLLSRLSDSHLA